MATRVDLNRTADPPPSGLRRDPARATRTMVTVSPTDTPVVNISRALIQAISAAAIAKMTGIK
jgi:hypothetical protein